MAWCSGVPRSQGCAALYLTIFSCFAMVCHLHALPSLTLERTACISPCELVQEGTNVVVRVVSSEPLTQSVIVALTITSSQSSSSPDDFFPMSTTLGVPQGSTSAEWTFLCEAGDGPELEERFAVTLSVLVGGDTVAVSSTNNMLQLTIPANEDPFGTISIYNALSPISTSEGALISILFRRTGGRFLEQTVSWAISPSTGDFQPNSGVAVIPDGAASTSIVLSTVNDNVPELQEKFSLAITQVDGGASVDDSKASRSLLVAASNFPLGTFNFESDATLANEGDTIQITVLRSGGALAEVQVDIAVADTTLSSSQYSISSPILVFSTGQVSGSISVSFTDDTQPGVQDLLTLVLSVGDDRAQVGSTAQTSFVLAANDNVEGIFGFPQPNLQISEPNVTSKVEIVLQRQHSFFGEVELSLALTGNTDGVLLDTPTVAFASGQTLASAYVQVQADLVPELTQSFSISIASVSSTYNQTSIDTGVLNISIPPNDDAYGRFQLSSSMGESRVTAMEGETVIALVTRTGGAFGEATVFWRQNDTSSFDFSPANGSVFFADGQQIANFTISIKDDTVPEEAEAIEVQLTTVTSGVIDQARSTLFLAVPNNDDPYGIVSVQTQVLEAYEPSADFDLLNVRLVRGPSLLRDVIVRYEVRRSSVSTSPLFHSQAVSGRDFLGSSGSVTFSSGEYEKGVPVTLVNDLFSEASEGFEVHLLEAWCRIGAKTVPVRLENRTTTVVIAPNDVASGSFYFTTPQELSIVVAEPNRSIDPQGNISAFQPWAIGVTRSKGLYGNVTVHWEIDTDVPSDFTVLAGSVVFSDGQDSATFLIPVAHDTIPELAATSVIRLTGVTGGFAGQSELASFGQAKQVTIAESDDPRGVFNFASTTLPKVVVEEPSSGVLGLYFDVERMRGTFDSVTVYWKVIPGATLDVALDIGQVVFEPAQTQQSFLIEVNADDVPEVNETFSIQLSTDRASVGSFSTAQLVILPNDDPYGVYQFANLSSPITMNERSTPVVAVPVHRARGRFGSGTVFWELSATDGTDVTQQFVAVTGNVSFDHGQSDATILLEVIDDATPEFSSSFSLRLTTASPGRLGSEATVAQISVDASDYPHGLFEFAEAQRTVKEPTADGSVELVSLLVRRSYGTTGTVRLPVQIMSLASQGVIGQDVQLLNTMIVFEDGSEEIEKLVNVTIAADDEPELDELFRVTLGEPQLIGYSEEAPTLGNSFLDLLIEENDDPYGVVQFKTAQQSVFENQTLLQIPIERTAGVFGEQTLTLQLQEQGLSSVLDFRVLDDLVNGMMMVMFGIGERIKFISLFIVDDSQPELAESLLLTMVNVSGGARILPQLGQLNLTVLENDDVRGAFGFSASSLAAVAATLGETKGNVSLSVTRTGAFVGRAVLVWNTTSTPTHSGISPSSGIITFANGQDEAGLVVKVINDNAPELETQYPIQLSLIEGGTRLRVSDSQAVITVAANDDPLGVVELRSTGVSFVTYNNQRFLSIALVRLYGTLDSIVVTVTVQSAVGGGDCAPQSWLPHTVEIEMMMGNATGSVSIQIPSSIFIDASTQFCVEIVDATTVAGTVLQTPEGYSPRIGTKFSVRTQVETSVLSSNITLGQLDLDTPEGSTAQIQLERVFSFGRVEFGVQLLNASEQGIPHLLDTRLVLESGQTTGIVLVTFPEDTVPETSRTWILSLTPLTNSSQYSHPLHAFVVPLVEAASDNPYGLISFQESQYYALRSSGLAKFTVTREGGLVGDVRVVVKIANGTALLGEDIETPLPDTFVFSGSNREKSFYIPLVQALQPLPVESLTVKIEASNALGPVALSTASVTLDIQSCLSCKVGFVPSTVSVGEGAVARVQVERTPYTFDNVFVTWSIEGDDAASQFTQTSGLLNIGMGETTANFSVSLVQDSIPELETEYRLVLLAEDGDASISATGGSIPLVALQSDNPYGLIQMQDSSVHVAEGETVDISIARAPGSGTVGNVTVTLDVIYGITALFSILDVEVSKLAVLAQGNASSTEACLANCALSKQGCTHAQFDEGLCTILTGAHVSGNTTVYARNSVASEYIAFEGHDFVVSHQVVIQDGQRTASTPFEAVTDFTPEPDQSVYVRLARAEIVSLPGSTSASGVTVPLNTNMSQTRVTIEPSDDAFGVFSLGPVDATWQEGEMYNVTVHRAAGVFADTKVRWKLVEQGSGHLSYKEDFEASEGIVAFPDSVARATFSVHVLDDFVAEGDRVYTLELLVDDGDLGRPANASASSTVITVPLNDDGAGIFELARTNLTLNEGQSYELTVLRRNGAFTNVSASITSNSPSLVVQPSSIMFLEGEQSKTVTVTVTDDSIPELATVALLKLSVNGGRIDPSGSNLTVKTRESDYPFGLFAPTLVGTVREGYNCTLRLDRLWGTIGNVTVDVVSVGLNSSAGVDFMEVQDSVLFADGQTSANVTVVVLDDTESEGIESFQLNLTVSGRAELTQKTVEVSIPGSDNQMEYGYFSIVPNMVAEHNATLTLKRQGGLHSKVLVVCEVFPLSALDFFFSRGNLQPNGFPLFTSTAVANATKCAQICLAHSGCEGFNYGAAVKLCSGWSSTSLLETAYSATFQLFEMRSGGIVHANADDFQGRFVSVTFQEGDSLLSTPLPFTDDDTPEPVEVFGARIANVSLVDAFDAARSDDGPAALAGTFRVSVRPNDDWNGVFSICQNCSTASVAEGSTFKVTVLRNVSLEEETTVVLRANSDQVQPNTTQVVFQAGVSEAQATFLVTDDDISELETDVTIELISSTGASTTLNTPLRVTVLESDLPGGTISVETGVFDMFEGEKRVVALRRAGASLKSTTVEWAVTSSCENAPIIVPSSGNVTFGVAQQAQNIELLAQADAVPNQQCDYVFELVLVSEGAKIASRRSVQFFVVGADDVVGFASTAQVEMDEDTDNANHVSISLVRTTSYVVDASVQWELVGDGAAQFVATNGSVGFVGHAVNAAITLVLINDTTPELVQEATLVLSWTDDLQAMVNRTSLSIFIHSSDEALGGVELSQSLISINETQAFVTGITLTRLAPSLDTMLVTVTTRNGSARSNLDFVAWTETFAIHPDESSVAVEVPILNDEIPELAEEFFIQIVEVVAADGVSKAPWIGETRECKVKINHNDDAFGVFEVSANKVQGTESAGVVEVGLVRSGGAFGNVTVEFELQSLSTVRQLLSPSSSSLTARAARSVTGPVGLQAFQAAGMSFVVVATQSGRTSLYSVTSTQLQLLQVLGTDEPSDIAVHTVGGSTWLILMVYLHSGQDVPSQTVSRVYQFDTAAKIFRQTSSFAAYNPKSVVAVPSTQIFVVANQFASSGGSLGSIMALTLQPNGVALRLGAEIELKPMQITAFTFLNGLAGVVTATPTGVMLYSAVKGVGLEKLAEYTETRTVRAVDTLQLDDARTKISASLVFVAFETQVSVLEYSSNCSCIKPASIGFMHLFTSIESITSFLYAGDHYVAVSDSSKVIVAKYDLDSNAFEVETSTQTISSALFLSRIPAMSLVFGASDKTVDVYDFSVAAIQGDYYSSIGQVSFADGQREATVSIELLNDNEPENDEDFVLQLLRVSAGRFGTAVQSVVTIAASDGYYGRFFIQAEKEPIVLEEPSAGTTRFFFTVERQGLLNGPVSLGWKATSRPNTLSSTKGALTFGQGDQTKRFFISVPADDIPELDDMFIVELLGSDQVFIIDGKSTQTVTVLGNDAQFGGIGFSSSRVLDVSEGSIVTLTVERQPDGFGNVTVNYVLLGNTDGVDDLTDGVLTFAPSLMAQTQNIQLHIANDTVPELQQTFTVVLAPPEGPLLVQNYSSTTVQVEANDVPYGVLALADLELAVNFDGRPQLDGQLVRRAGLFAAWTCTVSVFVEDMSGQWLDLNDFVVEASGTGVQADQLVLAAGNGASSFSLLFDESAPLLAGAQLRLVASECLATLGAASDSIVATTVLESQVQVPVEVAVGMAGFDSADPILLDEVGAEADSIVSLKLMRLRGIRNKATVSWQIVEGETDFVLAAGNTTIPSGEGLRTILVEALRDGRAEADEQFQLQLTSETQGLVLFNHTVLIWIVASPDAMGAFGILPGSLSFTSTPTQRAIVFGVERSEGTFGAVLVTGNVQVTSSTSEVLFSDQVVVLVKSDSNLVTSSVNISLDTLFSFPSMILLTLSSVQSIDAEEANNISQFYSITPLLNTALISETSTILHDSNVHGIVSLVTASTEVEEGNAVAFQLARTAGVVGDLTVHWALTFITANPSDVAERTGQVNIEAGQVSGAIVLSTVDDSLPELAETFQLTLTQVDGGALIGSQQVADVTLVENDQARGVFALETAEILLNETDADREFTVSVVRTQSSLGNVSIMWQLSEETDVTPSAGVVSFESGQTSAPIHLTVVGDQTPEVAESILLVLTQIDGLTRAQAALGTIVQTTIQIAPSDDPYGVVFLSSSSPQIIVTGRDRRVSTTVSRERGALGPLRVTVLVNVLGEEASSSLTFCTARIVGSCRLELLLEVGLQSKELTLVFSEAAALSLAGVSASISKVELTSAPTTPVRYVDTPLTLTVSEEAASGIVAFEAVSTLMVEEGTTTNLTLVREEGLFTPVALVVHLQHDSEGRDVLIPDSVRFEAGVNAVSVPVTVVADGIPEQDELVLISIARVAGCISWTGATCLGEIQVGTQVTTDHAAQTLLVRLNDDPFGVVGFASQSLHVAVASQQLATLKVERLFGTEGRVEVSYRVFKGAHDTLEIGDEGKLVFESGQAENYVSVEVPAVTDVQFANFSVQLQATAAQLAGARLGDAVKASVTVIGETQTQVIGGYSSSSSSSTVCSLNFPEQCHGLSNRDVASSLASRGSSEVEDCLVQLQGFLTSPVCAAHFTYSLSIAETLISLEQTGYSSGLAGVLDLLLVQDVANPTFLPVFDAFVAWMAKGCGSTDCTCFRGKKQTHFGYAVYRRTPVSLDTLQWQSVQGPSSTVAVLPEFLSDVVAPPGTADQHACRTAKFAALYQANKVLEAPQGKALYGGLAVYSAIENHTVTDLRSTNRLTVKISSEEDVLRTPQCAVWVSAENVWDTSSCTLESKLNRTVTCTCNRLGTVAVLSVVNRALGYQLLGSLIVLFVGLVMLFVSFSRRGMLFTDYNVRDMALLALWLFTAMTAINIALTRESATDTSLAVVGLVQHYMTLALVACSTLATWRYRQLSMTPSSEGEIAYRQFVYALVWLLPAFVVGIQVAIELGDANIESLYGDTGGNGRMSFSKTTGGIVSFVVISGICFLLSVYWLVRLAMTMGNSSTKQFTMDQEDLNSDLDMKRMAIVLSLVWMMLVFGVSAVYSALLAVEIAWTVLVVILALALAWYAYTVWSEPSFVSDSFEWRDVKAGDVNGRHTELATYALTASPMHGGGGRPVFSSGSQWSAEMTRSPSSQADVSEFEELMEALETQVLSQPSLRPKPQLTLADSQLSEEHVTDEELVVSLPQGQAARAFDLRRVSIADTHL
eukprot:m.63082 g.63082  ORF g.63082 m.63082 type:complete len:5469 (-) comp11941_c0_seq1:496-16902(-)